MIINCLRCNNGAVVRKENVFIFKRCLLSAIYSQSSAKPLSYIHYTCTYYLHMHAQKANGANINAALIQIKQKQVLVTQIFLL